MELSIEFSEQFACIETVVLTSLLARLMLECEAREFSRPW